LAVTLTNNTIHPDLPGITGKNSSGLSRKPDAPEPSLQEIQMDRVHKVPGKIHTTIYIIDRQQPPFKGVLASGQEIT
jgi:hypothetical protein